MFALFFLLNDDAGMVPSPSPKLEDFLGGGPNMGAHHQYGSNEREAMALSLDSMYYHHHNQEPKGNRDQHHSLEFLQQPFRQQSSYFHPPQEGMCSAITGHDLYPAPLEEEHMADHGFPSLKNWVARHYNGGINVMGGDEAGIGSGSVAAIGYGDLHSLSLSMSPGSQSSCVTAPQHLSCVGGSDCIALDVSKKRIAGKAVQKQPVHRKSIDTFGQRTSQYRGVTRSLSLSRCVCLLWICYVVFSWFSRWLDGPSDCNLHYSFSHGKYFFSLFFFFFSLAFSSFGCHHCYSGHFTCIGFS